MEKFSIFLLSDFKLNYFSLIFQGIRDFEVSSYIEDNKKILILNENYFQFKVRFPY